LKFIFPYAIFLFVRFLSFVKNGKTPTRSMWNKIPKLQISVD
jgi:hypothetical protein